MTDDMAIRPSGPADLPALDRLYGAAFPQEDLRPLLRELLALEPPVLSFVVPDGAAVAGHVVFTPCGVAEAPAGVALLGPLAVAPGMQGSGLGSALVRHGLAVLGGMAVARVLVLGDPRYYGRFGFHPEAGVRPPFPLPEAWREAWQGLALRPDASPPAGVLRVPRPWQRPELWAP